MSRMNQRVVTPQPRTHEGAPAKRINSEDQLKRVLLATMLWEDNFYVDGQTVAEHIKQSAAKCSTEFLSALAIQARHTNKLRHAPLLILLELIKRGGKVAAGTVYHVVSRPDEIGELITLYWADKTNSKMLPASMKRGLARVFNKFDEYQFAKWDNKRSAGIRLRDAMTLVHPKPKDKAQEAIFKRIAEDSLKRPETHSSRAAAGMDKKENFTDLLQRNKLGYMALLKNLRSMSQGGVDESLIRQKIAEGRGIDKVLPFRFITAARHAPQYERELDAALMKLMSSKARLPGRTVLLVDVSWSMKHPLGSMSEVTRMDAASALAIILSGLCEDIRVYTFSNRTVEVPARLGMGLRDTILRSQDHSGTHLGAAVNYMNQRHPESRLIVITDEQSHDRVPAPAGNGWMLNVASYQNGVGYDEWKHIDGFSESCVEFIQEYESQYH